MKRIAFILLPHWPTQRFCRRLRQAGDPPPAEPFALTEHAANTLRLSALSPQARAAGLSVGMPLADARAQLPHLSVAERPFAEERADLERLARWCVRFSPMAAPVHAVFEAHGLMLDVTGVAHLFGDEADLAAAMIKDVRALRLSARVAIADTIGLSAALAGFDPRAKAGVIAPPGAGLSAIAHLPIAALRLEGAAEDGLRALGLKRVADVSRIARASLARRFGPGVMERLDQAAGQASEPLDPIAPATPIFAVRKMLDPVVTLEGLSLVARDLCASLDEKLDAAGLGARAVRLDLARVDGAVTPIAVGFARAEKAAKRLARVLIERMERALDGVDLGFGVEAAALTVTKAERPCAAVVDLDPDAARRAAAAEALSALRDGLAARLGHSAVTVWAGRESHWPERAQTPCAHDASFSAAGAAVSARPDRPLFLLARPEPVEAMAEIPDGPPRRFRWRRLDFRVARAEGPERIGAEWWRGAGDTRDYFRIETEEGRRLWLFREGLYGRETDRPRWYVHGAFA